MKITIELNDKQAIDLRDIMLTTYDCGSDDFPYQSDKMKELSKMICEAIDNAHTKDINDKNS
jgi:hypothetical protein